MGVTRILGIDPGLNRTGWGMIESEGNRLRHVAHGVAGSDPADALSDRLAALHRALSTIIADWRPDEAAVEEVFVNRNPASTLKLGMARGIALLVPAIAGLPVAEYAANLVKKSVVGTGHADKTQIAMMVARLLPGVNATADAADALAVAICHAHHRLSPRPSGEREGVYRPKPTESQITLARRLRSEGTDVERCLWSHLRNSQLGVKFRRQSPVLGFVADFLSNEAKLIVELDGGQHADPDTETADARRTAVLEQAGFRVLRFWNNQVTENLDGVLQAIADILVQRVGGATPSPGSLPRSDLSPLGRGEVK